MSQTQICPSGTPKEEPCPICYEDMTCAEDAELVFCRYSCGNNVHGRCMRVWSDHQAATSRLPLPFLSRFGAALGLQQQQEQQQPQHGQGHQ